MILRCFICFLFMRSMHCSLEDMNQFSSWDILMKMKGQVLFSKPGADKCFGVGIGFSYDYISLQNVKFTGTAEGANLTESILKEFTEFCGHLSSRNTHEYEKLPVILQDFDDLIVGDILKGIGHAADGEVDYDYRPDNTMNERTLDIRVIFPLLKEGKFDHIFPLNLMNEVITDFLANHVEDQSMKNSVVDSPLAKVARITPAFCNLKRKILHATVCFPILNFFDSGYIFEIVHKGQFLGVGNRRVIYGQVSLPSHVYTPKGLGDITPIDITKCTRSFSTGSVLSEGDADFFCPPSALMTDSKCRPPLLKGCEVVLADDRMLPKVRVFSNAYLIRSFDGRVERLCDSSNGTMLELFSPMNIWWRPNDQCTYILGDHHELPSLRGESFLTELKSELHFAVNEELLDEYFYDQLPGTGNFSTVVSEDESVWRHQRRSLFVQTVDDNKIIVGFEEMKEKDKNPVQKIVITDSPPVTAETTISPVEESGYSGIHLGLLICSLLLNCVVLVLFIYTMSRNNTHQKIVIDDV